MFARRLEDLAGTDKEMVRRDGDKVLHARRLLTKDDGCGFSLADVRFSAGFSIRPALQEPRGRQSDHQVA